MSKISLHSVVSSASSVNSGSVLHHASDFSLVIPSGPHVHEMSEFIHVFVIDPSVTVGVNEVEDTMHVAPSEEMSESFMFP